MKKKHVNDLCCKFWRMCVTVIVHIRPRVENEQIERIVIICVCVMPCVPRSPHTKSFLFVFFFVAIFFSLALIIQSGFSQTCYGLSWDVWCCATATSSEHCFAKKKKMCNTFHFVDRIFFAIKTVTSKC